MNLINVIKEIQNKIEKLEEKKKSEIERISQEYDKEIADYKKALEVNMKLNTVCIECEGKGKTLHYLGYQYDEGEWRTCQRCRGTGVEPHSENEAVE